MESKDSYGDSALLPALPDELVLTHLITRLPWYTRPVCRAVSKKWRATIDASTKSPELLVKSRHHLLPLLQGHFLVCTFDCNVFMSDNRHGPPEGRRTGYYCVKSQDGTYQVCRQWRKLPSLQRYLPPPADHLTIMASCGMLYAWSNHKSEGLVVKMDMAGGAWTWNRVSVPFPFNARAVLYNAKIYIPGVWMKQESAGIGKNAVLVHDMMDEQSEVIKTWNRDTLRVLSTKKTGAAFEGAHQELYSLVEHDSSSKLKILVYEACKDSWRTKDIIPFPEWRWSDIQEVKLVNGDCFEPEPDGGINIVYMDFEDEGLLWLNSSLHKRWVVFDYNGFLEGKTLEHLQFIHGQLYGMFAEDKDSREENTEEKQEVDREKEQDPLLCKWTIMKGTMAVKTNEVHWEEVLDVGSFSLVYFLNPGTVSPVGKYTLMV